jgi:hypothetical protein
VAFVLQSFGVQCRHDKADAWQIFQTGPHDNLSGKSNRLLRGLFDWLRL